MLFLYVWYEDKDCSNNPTNDRKGRDRSREEVNSNIATAKHGVFFSQFTFEKERLRQRRSGSPPWTAQMYKELCQIHGVNCKVVCDETLYLNISFRKSQSRTQYVR